MKIFRLITSWQNSVIFGRQLPKVGLDRLSVVSRQVSSDLLDRLLTLGRGKVTPSVSLLNLLSIDVAVAAGTGDSTVVHGRTLTALVPPTLTTG